MVPLLKRQGLTVERIRSLVNNRAVYIWGYGTLGMEVLTSLKKSGIVTNAFIDDRPIKNSHVHGIPILSASTVITSDTKDNIFVIIASVGYKKIAMDICKNAGMRQEIDYITYYAIARPIAAINVSGNRNLCSDSHLDKYSDLSAAKMMDYNVYGAILRKVSSDVQQLVKIELSVWGEPLLHPQLPEIIHITETMVPCSVTTSLMSMQYIEPVVESAPSELCINVEHYDQSLCQNIRQVKQLHNKYQAKTLIFIKAHLTSKDHTQEKFALSALAKELDIPIEFCHTYMDYDLLIAALSNGNSNDFDAVAKELPWKLEVALSLASRDIARPCLPQRIFPVINWDASVSLCHIYAKPVIAINYLDIEWEQLLEIRQQASHCHICQQHALHRLDLNVLFQRYPNKINSVYQE